MVTRSTVAAFKDGYTVEQVLNGEHPYNSNSDAYGPVFAWFSRRGYSIEDTATVIAQSPLAEHTCNDPRSSSYGRKRRRSEEWLIKDGYRLQASAAGAFGWSSGGGIDSAAVKEAYDAGQLEEYFASFPTRVARTREKVWLAYLLSNLAGDPCQSVRYMAKRAGVAPDTLATHTDAMVDDGALWEVTPGKPYYWNRTTVKGSLHRKNRKLGGGKAGRYRASIPFDLRSRISLRAISTTQVVTPVDSAARGQESEPTGVLDAKGRSKPDFSEPWVEFWERECMWQEVCPTCCGNSQTLSTGVYICRERMKTEREYGQEYRRVLRQLSSVLGLLLLALRCELPLATAPAVLSYLPWLPILLLLPVLLSKIEEQFCPPWKASEQWYELFGEATCAGRVPVPAEPANTMVWEVRNERYELLGMDRDNSPTHMATWQGWLAQRGSAV